MKKFKLLLLDTNIIIKAFELGVWETLIERCNIWLASTIVQEAKFFMTDDGVSHPIDLSVDLAANRVQGFVLPILGFASFRTSFDPSYLEKLDDGEVESLAYPLNSPEPFLICSADKIVFRVLGNLKRSDQGISFEEVLQGIGLSRALPRQFSRVFRVSWGSTGFAEGLGGIGLKNK